MRRMVLAVAAFLLVAGCKDARMAQFDALGKSGTVTCYSGGQVVYSGRSTGSISNQDGSDGYYFMDDSTKALVEVSGTCIVRFGR